jgi:hypothetical protein
MAYFYNKNERLPGLRQEVKGNLMLTAGIRDQQRKSWVSARVKRDAKEATVNKSIDKLSAYPSGADRSSIPYLF